MNDANVRATELHDRLTEHCDGLIRDYRINQSQEWLYRLMYLEGAKMALILTMDVIV